MKRINFLLVVISALIVGSCKPKQTVTGNAKDDGIITVKFIQLNDVYEIASLSGGKYGGMDRVAYVRDSISKVNPNTLMFMAGDFLNPSLLGNLKYEGERIRGKQMVEVMNAMDFDLVTFGNHEFDVGQEALQKRLNESNFQWVSANVKKVTKSGYEPFSFQRDSGNIPVPDIHNMTLIDDDGTKLRLGFVSVTIGSNPQSYVQYGDIFQEAKRAYSELEENSDVIIGLTHVTVEDDEELAKQLPGLKLIMGGHEHNNMLVPVNNSTIAKADANAKTIYIHTLTYDTRTKELKIDSYLMPINERVGSDPKVKAIVKKWSGILETQIEQVISDPYEVIYFADPPLDGTDSANRSMQTNLGAILTQAMANSFTEELDGAIVNGGSIRLDDMLDGEVASLDIFRVLPFGGRVLKVTLTGDLLIEVLNFGEEHAGEGAYLHRYNISKRPRNNWLIGDEPIVGSNTYKIAFSDYLLLGYDVPFLTRDNKGVLKVEEPTKVEPASDIRKAVILYLKSIKK